MEAMGGAGCSDWNMDHYLLQASELYEAESTSKINSTQMPRLAAPKTEEAVKQARPTRTPKKTQIDTRYCIRIWKSWSQHRNSVEKSELIEHAGERTYLQYRQDISKNNPGGIKGRKLKPKVVVHHENTEDPSRCFVRLFKLYQSKCSSTQPKDAFHLQPLKKPTENCWFSPRPIGHCSLDNTVSYLRKSAGIEGYKTNHSLRVMIATRLFQAGIDKQLIMERTAWSP